MSSVHLFLPSFVLLAACTSTNPIKYTGEKKHTQRKTLCCHIYYYQWWCTRHASVQVVSRHSERGKKARQTEEEVGRQHQGMDRPGVRQVPEGSGELGKTEKTVYKVICGVPTTLAVKGLMMMMMMMMMSSVFAWVTIICPPPPPSPPY